MTTADVKHGTRYAYAKLKCRCSECRAWNTEWTVTYRANKAEAAPAPAAAPAPISHARPLRIFTGSKPLVDPTFVATPVDDCGEQIGRGRWCTHRLPCPTHGDGAA